MIGINIRPIISYKTIIKNKIIKEKILKSNINGNIPDLISHTLVQNW